MEERHVKRWVEDAEVDPLLQRTIDAARNQGPDAESLERVAKGVVAGLSLGAVGPGEAAQTQAAGGSSSAAAVSTGQVSMAKLAGIALVIGGLSAMIGGQLFDGSGDEPWPAPRVQEPGPAPQVTSPVTVPGAPELEPAPAEAKAADMRLSSGLGPAEKKNNGQGPTPGLERNPAEEVRLLRQAKRALVGAPAEALRMAREHERRFGDGTFGQEREALAIEALHQSGRKAEALRSLKRFRQRWPHSVYLRRIEERLGVERLQDE